MISVNDPVFNRGIQVVTAWGLKNAGSLIYYNSTKRIRLLSNFFQRKKAEFMRKIPGLKKMSPLGILTAEYVAVGVVVSLLSAFLGFYSAAYIIAEKCYPELGIETIQLVHRQLFHNMALGAAVYTLVIFALYLVFARSQLKSIFKMARQSPQG